MKEMGIWSGETAEVRKPVVSDKGDDVVFMNAPVSGVFIKDMEHGTHVEPGMRIGSIVDPLQGELLSEVISPVKGWLFTIREYPMVDEGSLMARILKE